jgi:hypothetical protein
MPYREIIPVYSEIHTKPRKAPSRQNVEFLKVNLVVHKVDGQTIMNNIGDDEEISLRTGHIRAIYDL